MRVQSPDAREYEMMIVFAPTIGDDGLGRAVERVSGYLATINATVYSITQENPWGRRRLAYPINDFRDAYYAMYRFISAAPSIDELEREIKLDDTIIRHLVVRYDQMGDLELRARKGETPGTHPFQRTPMGAAAEADAAAPAADGAEAAATDAEAAVDADAPVAEGAAEGTADGNADGAAAETTPQE